MVLLKNISYEWENGYKALDNVNMEIKEGEFVLISGESGSGKSTLGSVINGLIPHYHKGKLKGKVFINGKDTSEMMLYEIGRIVGTVFQDPRSQFFTTTTDEEIAFGLQTIVKTKEEIKRRVDEVYEKLDIKELKGKSVFELSSGQKQKTAIASICAMKPKILILDEPSANLDMKAVNDLFNILKILKGLGTTIILIEHRLYYVSSLFERFILVKDGQIKMDCSKDKLFEKGSKFFEKNGLRPLNLGNCKINNIKENNIKNLFLQGECLNFSYNNKFYNAYKNTKFVVKNLNFNINKGQIIGIIGKNGAGKTTFARLISGLEYLKSGFIKDERGNILREKERLNQSYFVFQDSDYQLFSESVLDEMFIGLSKDKNKKDAISVLKMLGLEQYINKHPFTLSRGEKQRLTIACGLMKDAKLFLYDEPTSGCDRNSMLAVSHLIKQQANSGVSVLIISHDFEFLAYTVNSIWVMNNGNIEKQLLMSEENKKEIISLMKGGK